MQKLVEKRKITAYSLLFMLIYLVSYITRINYGAVVSEISLAENLSKSVLSLALTGSFITYGAGQVISGWLGDRIQPKKLITIGFAITSLMNLLIPVCKSPYLMTAVWCINGFAQALMWPPIVRLMGSMFTAEDYSKACVTVSWGSSFGTILIYLVSPLIILASGWRAVFVTSAICSIIMIVVVNKACPKAELVKTVKAERAVGKNPLFSPVMLFIMLAIVLQGSLRDGVTTWMPSYIQETFKLDNEIAILSGVILPLFSILCFYISSYVQRSKLKNPVTCAGVIFGIGFIASAVLTAFNADNPAVSVFLSALLNGCMHGVNLMLICIVPKDFEKFGRMSLASGVLNAFTYTGSAVSTYGIAVLCESAGWGVTISVWSAIALLGTVICFACAKKYKEQIM